MSEQAETTEKPVEQDAKTRIELDHLRRIREFNEKVNLLQAEHDEAKAEAADIKRQLDAANLGLRALISSGPNPQQELPFNDDEPEWRARPLGEIGLNDKEIEMLAEAGLKTLGDLADFDEPLESIKGVGPTKAERIQGLLDSYWESHPVEDEQAVDEQEAFTQEVGVELRAVGAMD